MRRVWVEVLPARKDGPPQARVVFRLSDSEHWWPPAAARRFGEALVREAKRAKAAERRARARAKEGR